MSILVGVTGGMGAGKSTFAAMLGERGARLVDADRIGHEVIERPEVKAALLSAFGGDIETSDGKIDRRKLGKRAFQNRSSLDQLNAVVAPALRRELWRQVSDGVGARSEGIVVVDAALILEWGERDRFDFLIVVVADEAVMLARLGEQKGYTEAEIRQRMEGQFSTAEKIAQADRVVENNTDREALKRAAEEVWLSLGHKRALL
jgi:dephospho-CoA kinase